MHVYHDALPNFIPDAIWHSGCPECEHRAKQPFHVQVGYLDLPNQAKAKARAIAWNQGGPLFRADAAEAELLRNVGAALNLVGGEF